MAALSEKVLWPVVAIFIFGILAGFYIDDRRRMAQEGTSSQDKQAHQEHGGEKASSEHAGKHADKKQDKKEHAGKSAESKHSKSEHAGEPAKQTAENSTSTNSDNHGSSSMSMDEYLAHSSKERSDELIANVTHHQGFSGGIDEYLHGISAKPESPKHENNKPAKNNTATQQAGNASSMSMEEYQAKNSGHTNDKAQQNKAHPDAYHGDIEGYLAKFGGAQQTAMKKQNTTATHSSSESNSSGHTGFHGSYEEYAKKYN